jgi:hypothetical protein
MNLDLNCFSDYYKHALICETKLLPDTADRNDEGLT